MTAVHLSFFTIRKCVFVAITFLCIFFNLLIASPQALSEEASTHNTKPNILLIVTDDHAASDVKGFMPYTVKRIYERGLEFEKAYTSTPSCNASRVSLLTGSYASEHGASGNRYVFSGRTIANRLHEEAAYQTAHIGKFLNSWDGEKRPEYDYWVSFPGGSYDYANPYLNINGSWAQTQGYITDIFAGQALEFLKARKENPQPFFLTLSFTAPHAPSLPHPQDEHAFADIPLPRPMNFNELDKRDKPAWLRNIAPMSKEAIAYADWQRLSMRRCLPAVDRAIDSVLDELLAQGQLKNTMIIFMSDNGMFHGEHGLASKDAVYEEAIRIPLAVRYPGVMPIGSTTRLTGIIDVAASILDAAGLAASPNQSGVSFLGAADNEDIWRKYLLLESFRNGASRSAFAGVHTGTHVLVKNKAQGSSFDPNRYELYDLESDPGQMSNIFGHAQYANIQKELISVLRELLLAHRGRLNFIRPEAVRLGERPRGPEI